MTNNQQIAEKPQEKSFNKIILDTALRTVAAFTAVVVLAFAIFLWAAPKAAGTFFYKMGMHDLSARYTYKGAQKENTFEAWYASLVRGVSVDNFAIIYNSAKQLEAFVDEDGKTYDDLISSKDITVDGTKYSAKHYVAYHKVRAGVRHFGEAQLETFWNTAVEWAKDAKKFEAELTPMKGYLVAIAEDTSIPVDETEFMAILEEIYSKNTLLGFWISAKDQKVDFATYTMNLMNARGWETKKSTWNDRVMS